MTTKAKYADLEAVAAVVGDFFYDRKKLDKFYDAFSDDLGGMVGVWNYLIGASQEFEKVAKHYGTAGEDYDWLLAVQDFTGALPADKILIPVGLRALASKSIEANLYEKARKTR